MVKAALARTRGRAGYEDRGSAHGGLESLQPLRAATPLSSIAMIFGTSVQGGVLTSLKRRFPSSKLPIVGPKWQTLIASCLGGLLFVLVFQWEYSGINGALYQVRDDAVITMSHARNLVDYGFIGVNPSGGRVEGYSTPAQFFLYAAAYAVTGVGYAAYSSVQTVVATFLLGAMFVLFFPERKILAILVTLLAAVFLTYWYPFMGWHGSGMENAVTHTLFLSTVLILFTFVRRGRINYWFAVLAFLATISRIDGIYHVGPMLLVFSVFWLAAFRDWRGARFSLLAIGLWALFHVWRYLYFGDLIPNTAYAQRISVLDNIAPWLDLDWGRMRLEVVRAAAVLNWHGGGVLIALPILLLLHPRRETILLSLLLSSVALTSAFNESIFGVALLDDARTTTHLAVASAIAIAVLFYRLLRWRQVWWAVPAAAATALLIVLVGTREPYHLCCVLGPYQRNHGTFVRIADEQKLPRPTMSNPDLGALSYWKLFNVIDLAKLGSPVMAKLEMQSQIHYILHYGAPDIVELHFIWSCMYDRLLSDPRFARHYKVLYGGVPHWWAKTNCHRNPESGNAIWMRADILKSSESPERRLIDAMKGGPSTALLRHEIERCRITAVEPHDCAYVARTAYRFLPELRAQGHVDELEEIFANSPSAPFDLYLVRGYRDGQAHQSAIRFILDETIRAIQESAALTARSKFDLYVSNDTLYYIDESCGHADTKARFFLHVTPTDEDALPGSQEQHSFENLDFDFTEHGTIIDGKCFASVDLPRYDIAHITTGQFTSGDAMWEAKFHLDEQ